jgi:hypothetical protein
MDHTADVEAIMNPEDSQQQPGFPQMVVPIALPYSGISMPRPPGTRLVTAMGVIGIIVAVIGLLTAIYGALRVFSIFFMSRAMPAMAQTQGAIMVLVWGAIAGAVLAAMLLTGSIALLRLCAWSRRLLNWWAFLYLASVVLFLLLEIQVVVPSESNMFANIAASMPEFTAPTSAAGGVTITSNMPQPTATTNPAGGFTMTANAVAQPMPVMVPAQMAAMMRITYSVMAYVKAFICLIFPIAVLIVMQLRGVRVVLAPVGFPQHGPGSPEMPVR